VLLNTCRIVEYFHGYISQTSHYILSFAGKAIKVLLIAQPSMKLSFFTFYNSLFGARSLYLGRERRACLLLGCCNAEHFLSTFKNKSALKNRQNIIQWT
jgi:hypothetical protein